MRIPQNIDEIIEELIDQYLEDDRYNRPWIIGFSGGKDSTILSLALSYCRSSILRRLYRRLDYVPFKERKLRFFVNCPV